MGSMSFREEIPLRASTEVAWKVLADSARLNEFVGSAPYRVVESLDRDGRLQRRAVGKLGPLVAEWVESYGEWVEHRSAVQERFYHRGPLTYLRVNAELREHANGSVIVFSGQTDWRSWLGTITALLGIPRVEFRKRARALARLVEEAANEGPQAPPFGFSAAASERLERLMPAWKQAAGSDVPALVIEELRSSPATHLQRMRPLALSRRWQRPLDVVVRGLLAGHAAGAVTLQWDVLCPRCRGAKAAAGNLYDLPQGVHCSSCNIDYERDFINNVELTFKPATWLRPLPEGSFCMLGPATTPHVRVQAKVAPRDHVTVAGSLSPGRYRARTAESGPQQDVDIESGHALAIRLTVDSIEVTGAAADSIVLRNDTDRPRTFVIEDRAWAADALTGDRVIAMPVFRELCPEQVVRPGDQVAIGHVAILFADIRGSTALYAEVGDVKAYGLVRDYFGFFERHLKTANGVLIKTMGDAVMAAFAEPGDAIGAAIAIHRDITEFGRTHGGEIVPKIGLHVGPCIAVNTNGVLDYFGTTVNLAARLETASRGDDIVLSASVAADPVVGRAIVGLGKETESIVLRGFTDPVAVVRVRVPAP